MAKTEKESHFLQTFRQLPLDRASNVLGVYEPIWTKGGRDQGLALGWGREKASFLWLLCSIYLYTDTTLNYRPPGETRLWNRIVGNVFSLLLNISFQHTLYIWRQVSVLNLEGDFTLFLLWAITPPKLQQNPGSEPGVSSSFKMYWEMHVKDKDEMRGDTLKVKQQFEHCAPPPSTLKAPTHPI